MIDLRNDLSFLAIFAELDHQRISSVENALNFVLPRSFRNFLQELNGIQFLGMTKIQFHESEEFTLIGRIFGIAPHPMEGDIRFEQISRFLRDWQVPSRFICFGEGPSSQFLLEESGEVFEWESQTRMPENADEARASFELFIEPIADTFEQFLQMLEPSPWTI